MFHVRVEGSFSSAHNLRGYKGKCEELHGHNWRIEAVARSESLDETGMVLDFKIFRQKLNAILETLDHSYLNDVPQFKQENPTSELIARFIYRELKKKGVSGLESVTVWETPTSWAQYEEQDRP